jgi:hypothetical protein
MFVSKLKLFVVIAFFSSFGYSVGHADFDSQIASASGVPVAPTNSINVCVDQKTGVVRIPPNGKCAKSKERLVAFGAGPTGPAGPAGAAGPAGVAGPAGPAGTNGVNGLNGSITGLRTKTISFYTGSFGGCGFLGTSLVRDVTFWGSTPSVSKETLSCSSATVYVP